MTQEQWTLVLAIAENAPSAVLTVIALIVVYRDLKGALVKVTDELVAALKQYREIVDKLVIGREKDLPENSELDNRK